MEIARVLEEKKEEEEDLIEIRIQRKWFQDGFIFQRRFCSKKEQGIIK